MAKRVKIKSFKKMSINDKKQEFLRPDFVYIPLVSHSHMNCECLVKIGDKVNKGSVVGKRLSDDFPIIATVSGAVTEIKEMIYLNGEMVKTIVIKNDYKEKVTKVNTLNDDISKLSKDEFIGRLKKHGVSGLSGSDFSTYIKYSTHDKLKILLVNGVECEPYITSDYMVMKQFGEEILETIDAIIMIMGLERAIIAIRDDQKDIKIALDSILGTYPNIDVIMVKDYYPVGWEKKLIKEVLHLNYEGRTSEAGVIVNNVSTIYEIYQALRYDKPMTEKYITITGNAVKKPQNILVKIGVRLDEVIAYIDGYESNQELVLITNGPLMGKTLGTELTMVVKPLTGIIINKYEKVIESPCIRCGKCVDVCPSQLSPVLIMQNIKKVKELKKLKCEKCIHCGLCSYICPAKIDVRNKVMMAKDEVLK